MICQIIQESNVNFFADDISMFLVVNEPVTTSEKLNKDLALREKCPNTEFFLVYIFLYLLRKSPYSVRIQENTDENETPYLDTLDAVFTILACRPINEKYPLIQILQNKTMNQ